MASEPFPGRVPRGLTLLGVAVFCAFTAASIARYSGGHGADRHARGYSWLHNYWCDLYRARALDGGDHALGALLAQLGALGAVVAIFSGFWCASAVWAVRARPRLARLTRVLSVVACSAMLAVPLTPADRFGRLHFIVVGLAAFPALVAFVLSAASLTRASRTLRWLTALALGMSVLHFAHYLAELWGGAAWGAGIAAEQKLVTVVDFGWLLAVALAPPEAAPP